MKVQILPLDDFEHSPLGRFQRNRETWIERAVAEDLERAGLVRILTRRADRVLVAQPSVAEDAAGKAAAAGREQRSSSSPAAPVSAPTTSKPFESGESGPRRRA